MNPLYSMPFDGARHALTPTSGSSLSGVHLRKLTSVVAVRVYWIAGTLTDTVQDGFGVHSLALIWSSTSRAVICPKIIDKDFAAIIPACLHNLVKAGN